MRLLHDRIDLTVESLRKNPPILKPKKADNISTSSVPPPMGVPNWCLNQEALKQFNRSSVDIPVYDDNHDDNTDDNTDNNIEDEEEIPNRTNSNRKKKRKTKKKPKQKRAKKHKSK